MSRATAGRTHGCGDLRATNVGDDVRLSGWVAARRDHGGIHFVDLRDRYGVMQLVADEDASEEIRTAMRDLHSEYCIQASGKVRMRIESQRKQDKPTGEIELLVEQLEILSRAERLPFQPLDDIDVPEEMRMKYRYLDLRRPVMMNLLEQRSRANHAIRCSLHASGFTEVETPLLTKSTPEGARDYLVPSRAKPGNWYALPQSPQLFKQLSMVGGIDRYFQIARCLRDEDLRADRQPEFTQLDLEMSFVDEENVYSLVEGLMVDLYREVLDIELAAPFERMPYVESMRRFATDKPDLRNPLEIVDLAEVAGAIGFSVFDSVLAADGLVRGLRIPDGASLSRKQIDTIEQAARDAGAGGAAWCKVGEDGPSGPLSRFLKSAEGSALLAALAAEVGDLVVCIADKPRRALVALDTVRRHCGELMNLNQGSDRLLWITEFPLFEEADDGAWAPAHHPFTSPFPEDIEAMASGQKEGIRSRAYDLVLNGVELGSGSVRIHDADLQSMGFDAIGMDRADAERRFSFLLEAFRYGPPPHAGFAIGLDRLYALMFKAQSIREVIAFPKTATGSCPLTGAPTPVDDAQLHDLGLEQTSTEHNPE